MHCIEPEASWLRGAPGPQSTLIGHWPTGCTSTKNYWNGCTTNGVVTDIPGKPS